MARASAPSYPVGAAIVGEGYEEDTVLETIAASIADENLGE
jgi:hypothetical protein